MSAKDVMTPSTQESTTDQRFEVFTGEPGAVKVASPVRRGVAGKVPPEGRQLADHLPYEETADRLMQESEKAQENGPGYAQRTARAAARGRDERRR